MKKVSHKDSILTAKQFSAVDMKTGKTIWFSRPENVNSVENYRRTKIISKVHKIRYFRKLR